MPGRRYSKRVEIVRPMERNDFTADIEAHAEHIASAWAHIEKLSGWERVNAEQLKAGSNLRAYIRPPAVPIDASMQLIADSGTYEISAVVEVSDRELELTLVGGDKAGGRSNLR